MGEFDMGQPIGVWTRWDEQGRVIKRDPRQAEKPR
jgi:hypothetical protein